jgi:hypothetical protein
LRPAPAGPHLEFESRDAAGTLAVVALVAILLGVGLVLAIAAILVVREAGRIARKPPPALFDPDDAFDYVVAHVGDDVAATLTANDVRRILDFQLEFLKRRGVVTNGSTPHPTAPVVLGDAETTAYILQRSAETGEAYLPEQVDGVIETHLGYLRAIGAIGSPTDQFGESPSV